MQAPSLCTKDLRHLHDLADDEGVDRLLCPFRKQGKIHSKLQHRLVEVLVITASTQTHRRVPEAVAHCRSAGA